MQLPPRFHLTITGAHWRMRERRTIAPNELPYLLTRLIDGLEVADEALERYGLTVTIEPDMDQGDDERGLTPG
jgi:hypothetical protein